MGKSLKDKLKVGALGLGLAGALAMSYGCTPSGQGTLNPYLGAGLVLREVAPNAKTIEGARRVDIAGDALIGQGNAQSGRSEQNVIVINPGNNQQQQNGYPQDFAFSLTSYADKNGDGYMALEEFITKRRFYNGDAVGFCLYNMSEGGILRFIVTNEKGEVLKDEESYANKGDVRIRGPPSGLPHGKYIIKWERNGKFLAQSEIELISGSDSENGKQIESEEFKKQAEKELMLKRQFDEELRRKKQAEEKQK